MPGNTTTELPSVALFEQNCSKIANPGSPCLCVYKGRVITHDRLLQANPFPTDDAKLVQCPFLLRSGMPCTMRFRKSAPVDMARHQKAVHTNYREHVCPVCRAVFPQKTHLQTHMRIHTGQKVTCQFCEYRCTDGSQMARHMKHSHPGKHAPKLRGQNKKQTDEQSTPSTSANQSPTSAQPVPVAQQPQPSVDPAALNPDGMAQSILPVQDWNNSQEQMGNIDFSLGPVANSFALDHQGQYDSFSFASAPSNSLEQSLHPGLFPAPNSNQFALEQPSQTIDPRLLELAPSSGSQALSTLPLSNAALNGSAASTSIAMQRQDSGIGMVEGGILLEEYEFDFGDMVDLGDGSQIDFFADL